MSPLHHRPDAHLPREPGELSTEVSSPSLKIASMKEYNAEVFEASAKLVLANRRFSQGFFPDTSVICCQ
ncbi:hypothetical protein KKG19_00090, partial [Patescibacteria group bacterium]|nr:hypothetical protein [Patescibacteria group bacterium]